MEKEIENVKTNQVHEGNSLRRMRRILGIKQGSLAEDMGVSQQFISNLEKKSSIGPEMLAKVAAALKVTPESIQNMEETPMTVVIENNSFESGSCNNGIGYINEWNDNKTVHPLDKIVELSKENASLYERLMVNEKEKVDLLEKLLKEKE